METKGTRGLLGGRGKPLGPSLAMVIMSLSLTAVALTPACALAASPNDHLFDPVLSLEGDCEGEDGVADPGCPYQSPPLGPQSLDGPCGVATDPHGDIYVANPIEAKTEEGRVDVFDPKGEFLAEIPDAMQPCQVAADSEGNLYVVERKIETAEGFERTYITRYEPDEYPPDSGVEYTSAARFKFTLKEPGKFLNSCAQPESVAVDPSDDHLYVSKRCYVEEYGSAAEGSPLNPLIDCCVGQEVLQGFANYGSKNSVAVYGTNHDIYVTAGAISELVRTYRVFVFDGTTGELKCVLKGTGVEGDLEVDPEFDFGTGGAIAIDQSDGELYVYDLAHEVIDQFALDGQGGGECPQYSYAGRLPPPSSEEHPNLTGRFVTLAVDGPCRKGAELSESCNVGGKYDSPNEGEVYFTSGSNKDSHVYSFKERFVSPPEIEAQTPSGIGETEAVLEAELNPSGLQTTYHFQYTTQADFEQHGYANTIDVPVSDVGVGSGGSFVLVAVQVSGLEPGSAYRFRLVASSCADPEADPEACLTLGEGVPGGEGTDASFSTYPEPPPSTRAYELVTPPDTGGHIPTMSMVGADFTHNGFATTMASPGADDNSLLFGSRSGALPGFGGGGYQDLYEARRDETAGWQSSFTGISGIMAAQPHLGGISPDHAYAFWYVSADDQGALIEGGEGARYLSVPVGTPHSPNCAVPNEPEGRLEWMACGDLGIDASESDSLQGLWISAGGGHVVFETPHQVQSCAPPSGIRAIYDRTPGGVTHCVSLLPGEVKAETGQSANYRGTSADGSAVAFAIGSTLYVRLNDAETVEVEKDAPTFAGISRDGSTVFYIKGGNIFAFDTEEGTTTEVGSGGESTPVYISPDGSHAFFISPKQLKGEGEAGKDNLYAWDGSATHLIGVLDPLDLSGEGGGDVSQGLDEWLSSALNPSQSAGAGPANVPARSTPDGSVFLFESQANLAGHNSNGRRQVYRYEEGAPGGERLLCLSCNPTGVATASAGQLESLPATDPLSVLPPVNSLTQIANLTEDGRKTFFQSSERLVAEDLDERQDIYEWRARGSVGCDREGGCLALISSGESAEDDYLYAMTPGGKDVFFLSGDTLAPQDPDGVLSIYDAREGGGFPLPASPPDPCLGEACQPAVAAPGDVTPATSTDTPGNPHGKAGPPCPKGKHRARRTSKAHCAKSHGGGTHTKHKGHKHKRKAGR